MNPVRLIGNLRIKHKLLLSFFLVPLILVLCVGYVSYLSSTSALKKQSYDIINQYQQNTVAEILRSINRYELLANTIYRNTGIQRLISHNYVDPYQEYLTIITLLNPTLRAILDASEAGINIQLIRYHNLKSEIIPGNIENLLDSVRFLDYYIDDGRKQFQIVNYRRVEGLPWVQEVMNRLPGNVWTQVGYDSEYNYISLLHEITDTASFSREAIGLLRLTIMFNTLYSEDMSGAEKGFNLVFNSQMELLSGEPEKIAFFQKHESFLRSFSESSDNEAILDNSDLLLLRSEPFANDWYIVSVFPMTHITDNVTSMANIIILSFVLSGILLFLLTFLLSNSFANRINIIARKMHHFKAGNFDAKISGVGQDEIGLLGEIFNDMTEQISTLIECNYQSNIDKKEALLKALQAQINPHFLYNSLSAVVRLAESGETNEIKCMVYALAKFYRMTLSKGREIITVEDELTQVKAYMEIFRVRKGETFSVTYNIDENALPYHTLKVIIQPFVENIFEHALRLDDSVINIQIAIRSTDKHILFTVQDDGVGIPPEKLEGLLRAESSDSYGVANVNERIKLQFGADYGVTIASELDIGTRVDILIPKIKYW